VSVNCVMSTILHYNTLSCVGWDRVVSIATPCRLDGSGFEPWWGQEVFPSPHLSILALVSIQAPVRWVLGLFPRIIWWGVALTTHPHQELRLDMRRAMPPLLSSPLCACMACYWENGILYHVTL